MAYAAQTLRKSPLDLLQSSELVAPTHDPCETTQQQCNQPDEVISIAEKTLTTSKVQELATEHPPSASVTQEVPPVAAQHIDQPNQEDSQENDKVHAVSTPPIQINNLQEFQSPGAPFDSQTRPVNPKVVQTQTQSPSKWWSLQNITSAIDLARDSLNVKTSISHSTPFSEPNQKLETTSSVQALSASTSNTLDTHSSSASPLVFSLTSLLSSRTSIDTETISVLLDSPKIYRLCKGSSTYIGRQKEMPPQAGMDKEWREKTKPRLREDLKLVLQSLSLAREKTRAEPELCWVGEAYGDTNLVELRPTVIIRCASRRCQKAIDEAVKDLGYLQTFSKGRVKVHRGAPVPACSRSSHALSEESMTCCGEIASFLELAAPTTLSACGIRTRCLEESDFPCRQNTSIIGGFICVDNVLYGLTTGHTAVFWPKDNSLDTDSETDSEAESYVSSRSSSSLSSIIHPILDNEMEAAGRTSLDNDAYMSHSSNLQRWIPSRLGHFSYMGCRSEGHNDSVHTVSGTSDFALIELDQELQNLANVYTPPSGPAQVSDSTWTIDTISTDEEIGPVLIVCSMTDVRPAYLLEGDHGYMDRCGEISTLKIETAEPLGN
jgi:hypothetical protein